METAETITVTVFYHTFKAIHYTEYDEHANYFMLYMQMYGINAYCNIIMHYHAVFTCVI